MAITTHVLDTSTGVPAAGVVVRLERLDGTTTVAVGDSRTDADGRCRELTVESVPPGIYRLVFATGPWFATTGRTTFHPEIVVTFEVTDTRHHHVPLLLAPFGYSTYRGS